jgi:hypothetical protein
MAYVNESIDGVEDVLSAVQSFVKKPSVKGAQQLALEAKKAALGKDKPAPKAKAAPAPAPSLVEEIQDPKHKQLWILGGTLAAIGVAAVGWKLIKRRRMGK